METQIIGWTHHGPIWWCFHGNRLHLILKWKPLKTKVYILKEFSIIFNHTKIQKSHKIPANRQLFWAKNCLNIIVLLALWYQQVGGQPVTMQLMKTGNVWLHSCVTSRKDFNTSVLTQFWAMTSSRACRRVHHHTNVRQNRLALLSKSKFEF